MIYVWEEYRKIIIDKINTKSSINESVNRKSDYLDKVVDFIIQDTKFDFMDWDDQPYWQPPFEEYARVTEEGDEAWNNSLFDSSRFKISPLSHNTTRPPFTAFTPTVITNFIGNFYTYCKDTYGLTEDETDYTWSRYADFMKKKLNGDNPINESVDRRTYYLDKIVDFIVDDTDILSNNKKPLNLSYFISSGTGSNFSTKPRYLFKDLCMDEYGLTEDETQYVWDRFKILITKKMEQFKSINESVNRRSEYLDKVVEYLVDDTIIDYESKIWGPPFMTIWLERSRLFSHDQPHAGIFSFFYNYVRNNYGLIDGEMMDVWDKYTKSIIYKLKDS